MGPETLTPLYRPAFSAWLLALYSLAGSTAWVWHAVSVMLFALTTYLVYQLAAELLKVKYATTVTAVLFAVHPIHIEAVSWISACNELLIGLLISSSLLLYLREIRSASGRLWSYRIASSLMAWTLAIFTKESVLLLVTLFPYIAWQYPVNTRKKVIRSQQIGHIVTWSTPYVAAVALYIPVRSLTVGRTGLRAGLHTWAQVAYSTPLLFGFYIKKLFLPTGLSGFYVNSIVDHVSWPAVLIAIATCAILVVAALAARRKPAIGVAIILLLGPLAPVLAAVRGFADGDTAHDRYLFVPSIGLCLFAGIAFKSLMKSSRCVRVATVAMFVVVVSCFVWLTQKQQVYYRDEQAYFDRALQISPTNVLVMDYLGNSYLRASRVPEALLLFQRAYDTAPANPNAEYHLARALYTTNQYAAAEPLLQDVANNANQSALQRFKDRMLLAQDELALGRPQRARAILNDLAVQNPDAADIHFLLGAMDEVEGRSADARAEYLVEYKRSGSPLAGERALRLSRTR